jgi:transposase, IS30 family
MKYNQLTAADRGAIEVLLQQNYTLTAIAKAIGFSKSTVSREIKQRSTPRGYVAWVAQLNYKVKRKKCKQKKKLNHSKTQKYVASKLQLGWSPEQIAGRMKLKKREDRVCHETIYAWIYEDKWAYEYEKLYQYLRYGQKKRKKQNGRSVHRSKIPNRVSIHKRPEVVKDRTEYGHWEGDSVIYPYKMAINTINELKTGRVKFTKLNRKTASLTARAMSNQLKGEIVLTITLDNGSEFTKHETVSQNTGAQTYFCDPYSSWQRGANENANMLLRGYLPKRRSITDLTQDKLEDIASELNNRPRKRLGYKTPNEVYNELLVNKKGLNQPSVAVGFRM